MSGGLLVVGGGVAGLKTIETARDAGYAGRITLASDEELLPYDRPPLSKEALDPLGTEINLLWDAGRYADLGVEVRLGERAVRLDRDGKSVHFQSGRKAGYDKLVIAAGARARPFPGDVPPGVHTIRTIQDAQSIAARLAGQPDVVVVGAGFIGAEIASTARRHGCKVTVLEAAPVPLNRALGPVMGKRCADLQERNGVTVLTNQRILGFTGSHHVTGVETESGSVPAGLVVVGIGAIPNTEWLSNSGLDVGNGILCDEQGYADASKDIIAVGDVSSWFDPVHGSHHRHEHWTAAVEQGKIAGRQLAGNQDPPVRSVPYFWSDQHGTKIQMVGTARPQDDIAALHGEINEEAFMVAYHRNGEVSALLAFGMPRLIARHRKQFSPGQALDVVVGVAETLSGRPAVPAVP